MVAAAIALGVAQGRAAARELAGGAPSKIYCLAGQGSVKSATADKTLSPAETGGGSAKAGGMAVRTISLMPESGQRLLSLGEKFIFEGSLSLSVDGVELKPGRDYLLDHTSGTLLLRTSFPRGSTLNATFSFLPFELEEVYGGFWRAERPRPGAPGKTAPAPGGDLASRAGGKSTGRPSLTVGGSKRLAFEFGTGRDLTVSQSLDLDIAGKVGRDVEVRAVLSDRNLPLLPEGNTQTLEELDEVFVKVTSPSLRATFGDYTLLGPPSEFGRLSRTVEGVEASATRGDEEISVATASPRGKFRSVEFMGEEGKQGAYYVTGPDGRAATVVPGSEKVWIDGELIRRGAAAGYTIDYAAGAITFTSARTITQDTRLTVDYEYSYEEYRRSLYSVVGRTNTGPLGITASYAVERDDRNSVIGAPITDEEKSKLEDGGDSLADGALPDSSSAGGESRVVRPPSSHEMVDVAVAYSPWEALSLKSEVALSDMDLNTMSGRDDSDNKGSAYSIRADLSPRALSLSGTGLGTLEASASVRRTQASFVSMGRLSPAMDYDRWNLPAGVTAGGGRRSEFSMTYRPLGRISIAADLGHISMDDGGASRVLRLGSAAAGSRGYLVSWERARSEGTGLEPEGSRRDRGLARLRWEIGPFAPVMEAETETRRNGADGRGADYKRAGGELMAAVGAVRTSAALFVRNDYTLANGIRERESNAITQSYGVSYRGGSRLGLDGRYSLRTLSVDSTGARLSTYVAHFDGVGGMLDGAWGWRGSYEVTSTDEGPRTTVFVGPGKGHYDADGRYVGIGDYELDEGAGKTRLSSRVTLSFRSDLDWGKSRSADDQTGVGKILCNLRWSGLYRLEEHTRAPLASPSLILRPGSYMNPEDVIRGTSTARQDLEFLPRGRIVTPRLRYEVRRRLQNPDGESLSGTTLQLVSLRLRTRALSRTTVEAEQVWGRSSPQGPQVAAAGRRETYETRATVAFRPGPSANFSMRSSYLTDRSQDSGGGARWEFEPVARFSKPGYASIEARCKWAKADRDGSMSYDQLLGWLGDRVEYSLSGQVGLGAGLTLLGTLRATGVEWRDLSHYFKMEMRALF